MTTRSWVEGADTGDFPLANLPYGVFRRASSEPRCGVAIGDSIADLAALSDAGLLGTDPPLFHRDSLNAFFALPASQRAEVRRRLQDLLTDGNDELQRTAPEAIVARNECRMLLPVSVGDYVDFYSSLAHASNLGKMFRPDQEPLLPNWRHLPVGYHGRAGTIVIDQTPVRRPSGQRKTPDAAAPIFGPSVKLDFELELGFVIGGAPTTPGEPIPIERAMEHVAGVVLVNDWSARDIQAWEYVPLGPFLGKSFATSISPWIVPLEALEPFRVTPPPQEPPPLPHLRAGAGDYTLDIALEVALAPSGGAPTTISRTSARGLYWTMAQQLAHATSNGATVRPGDLFASGTISGDDPGSYGSMIELSWNGAYPVTLGDGSQRAFLEDGDTVTIRGRCSSDGAQSLGFGSVSGTILPAQT